MVELSIKLGAEISMETLFDGMLPQRYDLTVGQEDYLRLGKLPIQPVRITDEETQVRDYLMIFPALDGLEISELLYFVAPNKNKRYGLDRRDVTGDWNDLFKMDRHKDRLGRHRKLPGWDLYEQYRLRLVQSMNRGSRDRVGKYRPAKLLTPIFGWRVSGADRFWISALNDKNTQAVMESHDPTAFDNNSFDVLLGLLYMDAFAPDITDTWPREMKYDGFEIADHDETTFRTQPMGPSQTVIQAINYVHQTLNGQVVKAAECYLEAG